MLAGPGAGKTFCLIERIGFLIDKLDVKPERICVFTFTNKAAGEIADAAENVPGGLAIARDRHDSETSFALLVRVWISHGLLRPA